MGNMNEQPGYQFTAHWFLHTAKGVWDRLIPRVDPTRILEIGSYEGYSACYLIDSLASRKSIELHCVDTWEGGVEHKDLATDMSSVEQRFLYNIKVFGRANRKQGRHSLPQKPL